MSESTPPGIEPAELGVLRSVGSRQFFADAARRLLPAKVAATNLPKDFMAVQKLFIVQHQVAISIMQNAVSTLNADGLFIGDGDKLRVAALAGDIRIPFWGQVVIGESSVPKNAQKLKVGKFAGADMFLIPDESYPCPAWSVEVSQDQLEVSVHMASDKVSVPLPIKCSKNKEIVLRVDGFCLRPMAARVGNTNVPLCRPQSQDDVKSMEKPVETARATLKRIHNDVYAAELASEASDLNAEPCKVKKPKVEDVPAHLKHILL